ncbi:MAG: hypothetical protein ABSB89_03165 [Candidatus Bathyarchaeia archaeon]|jgi:hypothetical protein
MKTIQACILIAILVFAFSIASVSALGSPSFGGKSGDWAEYEYQDEMQVASGLPSSEFVRIDFLSVEGSNVTVNATLYTSSLQISNETKTIDLTSQNAQDDITLYPMFNVRAYFIPAGLNITDPVYLGELFGTQNITGQTTQSYAGADRTVIFTNFTLQGSNYYFYWDKQTGVLTEGLEYIGAVYTDVLITDTNIWSPPILPPLLLWVAIAIAIVLGVISSRRALSKKIHGKGNTKPSLTKTNSFLSFKQSKGKGY